MDVGPKTGESEARKREDGSRSGPRREADTDTFACWRVRLVQKNDDNDRKEGKSESSYSGASLVTGTARLNARPAFVSLGIAAGARLDQLIDGLEVLKDSCLQTVATLVSRREGAGYPTTDVVPTRMWSGSGIAGRANSVQREQGEHVLRI